MLLRKKYCDSICLLNLFQNLFISCLKFLVGMGRKDMHLVKTEDSSSVNVWSEWLCIMFFFN